MKHFLYSNVPLKTTKSKYGPVIAHLISVWHRVNQFMKISNKYFAQSPIFYNHLLLIGKKIISFSPWERQGVFTLGNIIGQSGLREFQELQKLYNLPASSFFFYLQLQTAMQTYGAPWGISLETHPLHIILSKENNNGTVSDFYKSIIKASQKPLPIENLWKTELRDH